ncbi:MAG: hypothetical protein PHS59_08915 [Paludibacter sp.]|nr:hypothetical protein [Paludibacter sp.]
MEYTFELINDFKIIEVKVFSIFEENDAVIMGKMIRKKAIELNYKILYDFSQSINRISYTKAYYWFREHYDNIDIKYRYIPTAHITNEEDFVFFNFFETTCINSGIRIKLFRKRDDALEWLYTN